MGLGIGTAALWISRKALCGEAKPEAESNTAPLLD
jgi:hypothetical protein